MEIVPQSLLCFSKIGSSVILTLISILGSMIPLFGNSSNPDCCTESRFNLNYLHAFGGGSFLSLGIIHLLPETFELLDGYYLGYKSFVVHSAPVLVVFGFLMILALEKIIVSDEDCYHPHCHPEDENHDQESLLGKPHDHGISSTVAAKATSAIVKSERKRQTEIELKVPDSESQHGIGKFVLFSIALTLHCIFEALAIGAENSANPVAIWSTTFAISLHKWCEGMVISIGLIRAKFSPSIIVLLAVIFALASPIGIFLGAAVSNSMGQLGQGVIMAIATGTILYVAICDCITEEFEYHRNRGKKFIALVCGVIVITLATAIDHVLTCSHSFH